MTDKKKSLLYIICAYLFFWIAFSLIGLVVMLIVEDALLFQDSALMQLMVAVAAWTPTLALFVLFKKLYPSSSLKAFYKNAFRERLNLKLLLCVTMIQLFMFFGAVGITAFIREVSFYNLLHITLPTLITGFVFTAIQGPTGEQSGWRGFLQPHMEKRFSVVKASVVVGIIWGFWHTPLWFTSGYMGLDLVQFIVTYMIGITCVAVIIGICYNCCKNLFVPIWIHFMFNFTLTMYTGELLTALTWLTILYVPVTIGYIIWHKRYVLKRMPTK
ncbi:MAG: CPBP family intramembrane metalloprotease [Oscillospiraceae bacterium]|nr:CPBP family intramembrane metalloprotease [Oscillospiraceae bacterium]